jgi:hypothetical protein
MPKDQGDTTKGAGHVGWDPICGPKQTESMDGVLKRTGSTSPQGAAKPDRSGK